MTHKTIPADKRRAAGVTDSLIRLSIGLEDAEDLVEDLKQALDLKEKKKENDQYSIINVQ
jgi:cystathionine beta-lyase